MDFGVNYDKKDFVWCSDFCVEDNDVWMFHGDFNGLMHYNLKSRKTQLLAIIPDNNIGKDFLFIRIMKKDNLIILLPCLGDHIVVYDLVGKDILYQKYIRDKFPEGHVFSSGFIIGEKVYCIPWKENAPIVSIDLKGDFSIEYIEFEHKIFSNGYNTACYHNDSIYCVSPDMKDIIRYDINKKSISYIEIREINGIKSISRCNDYFYLIDSKNKTLYQWNPRENTISVIVKLDADSSRMTCLKNGEIWIDTPELYAYLINVNEKTVAKFDKLCGRKKVLSPTWNTSCGHNVKGKFHYYNTFLSCFLVYDGLSWENYDVRTDVFSSNEYRNMIKQEFKPIKESACFTLKELLEVM